MILPIQTNLFSEIPDIFQPFYSTLGYDKYNGDIQKNSKIFQRMPFGKSVITAGFKIVFKIESTVAHRNHNIDDAVSAHLWWFSEMQ